MALSSTSPYPRTSQRQCGELVSHSAFLSISVISVVRPYVHSIFKKGDRQLVTISKASESPYLIYLTIHGHFVNLS